MQMPILKFSPSKMSYERQGWKNLTAFCETVLLDYFPRALVQYGCAPIYLWRWGRRPPDAPLANDGPMYLQTDGGDVNLYIMIREAANQKALAEARANKRFKVTKRAKATKRAKESDEEYVTEDEEDDDDE